MNWLYPKDPDPPDDDDDDDDNGDPSKSSRTINPRISNSESEIQLVDEKFRRRL